MFLENLHQIVHFFFFLICTVTSLCVCSVIKWKENQFLPRSSVTSDDVCLPWLPTESLQGQSPWSALFLYLLECFRVTNTFYVWKENKEENKMIENNKQLVKLAGDKVDSVILNLNGSFWRNADVIREITRLDGDFYRFYGEFWIILSILQVDGPRSSVWF